MARKKTSKRNKKSTRKTRKVTPRKVKKAAMNVAVAIILAAAQYRGHLANVGMTPKMIENRQVALEHQAAWRMGMERAV